jgi:tetratricopeptide (TPR) repeat protein
MLEHPDYYSVLHVSKQATQGDIKQAFRRLARQFHPDLNPNNPTAAARFKQLCEAYQVLGHPQRRSRYDRKLASDEKPSQSFQTVYLQGMEQLSERNYSKAIAAFTQAIAHKPTSIEAYLGRCQAHDGLQADRAVFEDCYQMLQINPQMAQAYYYQGRARARLGYEQGAIEAYTKAITLDEDFAQAYYRRGKIRLDLQDTTQARQDLEKAAALFHTREDMNYYQQTNALLNQLHASPSRNSGRRPFIQGGQTWIAIALGNILGLVFNPSDNLLPVFNQLRPHRAVGAGLLYGGIAMSFALATEWLYASQVRLRFALVSAVFYGCLVLSSAIARFLTRGGGHWAGDFFLSGVAFLPLSVAMLVLSALMRAGIVGLPILPLVLFASCYSIVILYVGCTQLSNIVEPYAMLTVPLTLLASGQVAVWMLFH